MEQIEDQGGALEVFSSAFVWMKRIILEPSLQLFSKTLRIDFFFARRVKARREKAQTDRVAGCLRRR